MKVCLVVEHVDDRNRVALRREGSSITLFSVPSLQHLMHTLLGFPRNGPVLKAHNVRVGRALKAQLVQPFKKVYI